MSVETTNKPITVGIAGQGRSGYRIHANWLKKVPEQFRIVAVADERPARRKEAEREFGAAAYPDYREMLASGGFELFVNALPTTSHVAGTIEALAVGCHVVCEKPAATTLEQLDLMIEAATSADRLLVPFQNNRLQPFVLKMMEVARSGLLGEILHVRSSWGSFARRWDWQTFQCNSGGVLFNTGPHAIDIALQFFKDDDNLQVQCRLDYRNSLDGDADDLCSLSLSAEQGPLVEIHITSFLAYPPSDTFTLTGSLGTLAGNEERLRWRYLDPTKLPRRRTWPRWSIRRQYPKEILDWAEGGWSIEPEVLQGPFSGYTLRSFQFGVKGFYDNLFLALRTGQPIVFTTSSLRRQIAIIEEAHRQNAARARRARKR